MVMLWVSLIRYLLPVGMDNNQKFKVKDILDNPNNLNMHSLMDNNLDSTISKQLRFPLDRFRF
jgi:hypothetical protein